jgi:hypothetical protein
LTPVHRRYGAVLLVAAVFGLLALLQSLTSDSMWVDRSFVPIRYAFSFVLGMEGKLPGQSEATLGFMDPLWVGLLSGTKGVGIQPVKAVQVLGPAFAALAAALLAGHAWRRFGTPGSLVPAAALIASGPFLAASRSGTDDVWLGFWTILVLVLASRATESGRCGWGTRLAMLALGLTGPFGLAVVTGVVVLGVRTAWSSAAAAAAIQLVVALSFGMDAATALWVDLSAVDPGRIGQVAGTVPVLLTLGCAALFRAGTGEPSIRSGLWSALVWLMYGVSGSPDTASVVDRFVPCLLAMTWMAAWSLSLPRKSGLVLVFAVLLGFVDVAGSRGHLEEIATERRVTLKESQVMARFLRWRFDPKEMVALHSPGSIAYHYGGPVIDASGRTEVRDVRPSAILAMRPSAMVPDRQYVGQSITFTPMFSTAQDALREQYDHHSVQHQRKWGLTKAKPVFFQYLTLKTLPRLPEHISEEDGNRFPKQ